MPEHRRKPRRSAPDRIDIHDADDLRYWMRELDVDEQGLKNAVKTVGSKPDDVRSHIALHAARESGRRPARRAYPRR
jgi:hypothetical protein